MVFASFLAKGRMDLVDACRVWDVENFVQFAGHGTFSAFFLPPPMRCEARRYLHSSLPGCFRGKCRKPRILLPPEIRPE